MVQLDEDANVVSTGSVIDVWKAPLPPILQSEAVVFGGRKWREMRSLSIKLLWNRVAGRYLACISLPAKGHQTRGPSENLTGNGAPAIMEILLVQYSVAAFS